MAMLDALRSILGNFGPLRLGRRELIALAGGLALPRSARGQRAEGSQVEERIWASYFRQKNVWGYATRHSVQPGENFEVFLSTGPKRERITGRIEFFRFGSIADQTHEPVWVSGPVEVVRQHVLRT